MTLFLERIDDDTVAVREVEELVGPPNRTHILLSVASSYEDIPYGVWVRLLHRTVLLGVVRAAAETYRSESTLIAEQNPRRPGRLLGQVLETVRLSRG